MKIKEIKAVKAYDSRANPTILIKVYSEKASGEAAAPSGASTGKYEIEAYTKDIDKLVKDVNIKFTKRFGGISIHAFEDLHQIEERKTDEMYGGNVQIALEFAILKCLANEENKPLWKILNSRTKKIPMPVGNVLGGGAHTGYGDIQEILLIPDTKTFAEAAKINSDIHHLIKKELKEDDPHFNGAKTDEGAWTTFLSSMTSLYLVKKVADAYAKKNKVNVRLGLDLAASQLFKKKKYHWSNFLKTMPFIANSEEQKNIIFDIVEKLNFFYIEDPLEENDFKGFADIQKDHPNALVVMDDLTTTNPDRLKKAIFNRSGNAAIVKPNQIGSLIKTKEFVDLCKDFRIKTVLSHRSGETNDATIMHLAKAWNADFVKIGIANGERTAKINEMIKIESDV